ncbi:hypothetical protein [Brevibacillus choshinensis]|uniref:hypothetical protein n=1 Tax=Brevibacillus choshinensis TaxID=54911 RepID=UPI002E24ABC1|nr:hypothetical protein [Brevibacillus choshinensis]
MIFKDSQHAWNPSPEEIRFWAYSNEKIPEQDWELAVNSFENIPMICSFIDDDLCNRKAFFLGSLYVFTGDIIRSGESNKIVKLSTLLDSLVETAKSETLKAWIERSKHLIVNQEEYDYEYWGLGSKYVD